MSMSERECEGESKEVNLQSERKRTAAFTTDPIRSESVPYTQYITLQSTGEKVLVLVLVQ